MALMLPIFSHLDELSVFTVTRFLIESLTNQRFNPLRWSLGGEMGDEVFYLENVSQLCAETVFLSISRLGIFCQLNYLNKLDLIKNRSSNRDTIMSFI